MLMNGFDGQMIDRAQRGRRAAAASNRRSGRARPRRPRTRALRRPARSAGARNSPGRSSQPSAVRTRVRTGSSLIGRTRGRYAEAIGRSRLRDRRQRLAGAQPPRALDVRREVAVAEPEPGLAAERLQRRHEGPGLVAPAPAALRMVEPGERVDQRVEVGRDREAEMLEIVAGIGDDGERAAARATRRGRAPAWRRRCRRTARRTRCDARRRHRNRSSLAGRTSVARRGRRRRPAKAAHEHDRPRLRRPGPSAARRPRRSRRRSRPRSTCSGRPKRSGAAAQVDAAPAGRRRRARCRPCRAARPAEAVVDDDRRCRRRTLRRARARSAAALSIGVARQQQHALAAVLRPDVRLVDAGVRHHEAEPMLDDQHVRPPPHDPRAIPTGSTSTRRGSFSVSRARARRPRARRRDRRELDEAAFGLRDDLLRHDEHVASPRRTRPASARARRSAPRGRRPAATIGKPASGGDRASRDRARRAPSLSRTRARSRGSTSLAIEAQEALLVRAGRMEDEMPEAELDIGPDLLDVLVGIGSRRSSGCAARSTGSASASRSISSGSSTDIFSSGESASAAQCRVSFERALRVGVERDLHLDHAVDSGVVGAPASASPAATLGSSVSRVELGLLAAGADEAVAGAPGVSRRPSGRPRRRRSAPAASGRS